MALDKVCTPQGVKVCSSPIRGHQRKAVVGRTEEVAGGGRGQGCRTGIMEKSKIHLHSHSSVPQHHPWNKELHLGEPSAAQQLWQETVQP